MKIEIKNINSWQDNSILLEWLEFVCMPDVSCGFWCDPKVVSLFSDKDDLWRIVNVYDDDKLVAILPFKYSKSTVPFMFGLWRLGGVNAGMMTLIDYEFAILQKYDRKAIFDNVVAEFRNHKVCDLVMADNWHEPRKGARNVQSTYLIDMPDSFDLWMKSLSANTRQVLRRKKRRLEKQPDNKIVMKRFCDKNEMDLLHKYLTTVWKNSWHGRLKRQAPPSIDFLESVAEYGWVRSYVLFSGDNPIASVQGYQYNGVFMDEAPAYSDEWKRFSPGLVLNYCLMEDLFEHNRPQVVDFGFGYNQYKEMLGNRKDIRGQLWYGLNFKGKLIVFGLQICDVVFKIGKRVLGGTKFSRKAKVRIQSGERNDER